MARKPYLPRGENERLAWLFNLKEKGTGYVGTINITAGEAADLVDYYDIFKWTLDLGETADGFTQDITKFKQQLMIAPLGTVLGAFPNFTMPATPTVTPAGIFTIISGIVSRIKSGGGYTEAIGEDLKIIGADIIEDNSTKKPEPKITVILEEPKIKYKKQRTDGVNIYRDMGDGNGMKFLRFITKTTYTDPVVLPVNVNSAVIKYKLVYIVDDLEVGIESDVVTVTVKRRDI